MRLTVLGTGNGIALNCYNTCFTLDDGNEEYFLVDAGGGNGVLKQLQDSNIDILKVKNMFISHTHSDHILGAIWMLRAIARRYVKDDGKAIFHVYGNDEVINAIRVMANVVLSKRFIDLFDTRIKFVEVDTGDTATIIDKKIEFFDAKANKVKITGFVMWLNDKDKFTFIGDEYCKSEIENYVENSKWLFADAFMAGKQAEEYDPIKKHSHSTVKYVAELCERLNVENVIMTHTVDKDLENRKRVFTEDAHNYYKGNVYVPDDLEQIEIE